jgi:hypothetical protein
MEVCASGLSAVGVVFALEADEQEKLAEMLGSCRHRTRPLVALNGAAER